MNGDIALRVAYTEADTRRWAAAQVERDLVETLHYVRVGIVDHEAIAQVVEGCGRELAAAYKQPFGEVSTEVAAALEAVA